LVLLSVRIAHTARYWKFLLLQYIQVLCQYRLCKVDHLTYLMLQRQLRHLSGSKSVRRQVEASYIFCVWIHLFLCCVHVHSHDSVWFLLVARTILLYNRIYTEGWKPCANLGQVCTLKDFQWCGETFLQELQF
jgi:hypothetical protein